MTEANTSYLRGKYPSLFGPHVDFSCGDGWLTLLDKTCAELTKTAPKVTITTIKSKYGELRIYLDLAPMTAPDAHAIVDRVLIESRAVPE